MMAVTVAEWIRARDACARVLPRAVAAVVRRRLTELRKTAFGGAELASLVHELLALERADEEERRTYR